MNKLWQWLDGKKTVLALIYWQISESVIPIWFAAGLPEPWDKVNFTLATMLTILGLGHKIAKGGK